MTCAENGSKSVAGAVFRPVREEPYEVALSLATLTAPSTPTFIRWARNRSLRANVMWPNPLVKTCRLIARCRGKRNPRRLRVQMPAGPIAAGVRAPAYDRYECQSFVRWYAR